MVALQQIINARRCARLNPVAIGVNENAAASTVVRCIMI